MKGILSLNILLLLTLQLFAQSNLSSNEIISDSFEFGIGNWNDGGSDCEISTNHPSSGAYSIKLKDNSGKGSSIYSNPLELNDREAVKVSFKFQSYSMELDEKLLLEISIDGGISFETLKQWVSGKDFENEKFQEVALRVEYEFSNETIFRFRCIGSSNNDQIYLDEIQISEVGNTTDNILVLTQELKSSNKEKTEAIKIFPNPARDYFSINLAAIEGVEGSIEIYNLVGSKLSRSIFKADHPKIIDLPIAYLENGYYSVCVKTENKKLHVLRLMVSR